MYQTFQSQPSAHYPITTTLRWKHEGYLIENFVNLTPFVLKGFIRTWLIYLKKSSCLDEKKEATRKPRRNLGHLEQAYSFQSTDSAVCWGKATMQNELEPVHPSILPPYLNIWPLKFWNWRVSPQETTRRAESSQGTCSWPSETTKSWTSCWEAWSSPREAFCQT